MPLPAWPLRHDAPCLTRRLRALLTPRADAVEGPARGALLDSRLASLAWLRAPLLSYVLLAPAERLLALRAHRARRVKPPRGGLEGFARQPTRRRVAHGRAAGRVLSPLRSRSLPARVGCRRPRGRRRRGVPRASSGAVGKPCLCCCRFAAAPRAVSRRHGLAHGWLCQQRGAGRPFRHRGACPAGAPALRGVRRSGRFHRRRCLNRACREWHGLLYGSACLRRARD